MRGAIMYAPGDVRVEERAEPRIVEPTDAVIPVNERRAIKVLLQP